MRDDLSVPKDNWTDPVSPELYGMIGTDEKIVWRGKPHKKCFLLEAIFNPLLPFAAVWALFDGFFIVMLTHSDKTQSNMPPLIFFAAFFALHLMPVWLYLGGVLFSFLSHKHTSYVITDKAVYGSSGTFSLTYTRKPFTEIVSVGIHRGMIDQWLGVGDVEIRDKNQTDILPAEVPEVLRNMQTRISRRNGREKAFTLHDLADYQVVYSLLNDAKTTPDNSPTENN